MIPFPHKMENSHSVREIYGKKGGTYFTTGNTGFFYRLKEKRTNNKWKLICKSRNCHGTAVLINPECSKEIEEKAPHSCEPDNLFEEACKLRSEIIDRCTKEITPSSEIFNEECTKR